MDKMTIVGTIEKKEISEGETNGKPWTRWVFTIDGKNYSTFNRDIGDKFKRGDNVQIEGAQKGQYFNMTDMYYAGGDAKPQAVKPGVSNGVQGQINRMSCLKTALTFYELIGEKPDSVTELFAVSNKLLNYVENGN